MIKKSKKIGVLIVGVILGVILTTMIIQVSALTGSRNVTVSYNNIKINIDGKEIAPKDANGNTVEPFNYNGTVYLPVRAIGEALGKDVSWDSNSQTVFLKPKAQATPASTQPADSTTPSIQTKTFGGRVEKSDSVNTHNFTLPYNSRVTLSLEHDFINNGSSYWHIQMLTKSGIIEGVDYIGNVMNQEAPHVYYLPAGDYIFRVTRGWNHSNIDYKFNIKYEKNIGEFEAEYNDTPQTATPIQMNKSMTGNIFPSTDVDYYIININSKKEISVKFNHDFINNSSSYWDIKILSTNNGNLMSFGSSGNVMETISDKITLEPGEYYVVVSRGWNHSTMDYTLTVIG